MSFAPVKPRFKTAALFLVSVLVSFVILEVTSRIVFFVSPGAFYQTPDGERLITREVIYKSALRFHPNHQYRQVSQEFDVVVTITGDGHRVPGPQERKNVDIVFLGDSFTFGHGLSDDQTFAALYCQAREIQCANLGRGGTGTAAQLAILTDFLVHENWRPREVRLFLVAMTSYLGAGNDLRDNLSAYHRTKVAQTGTVASTPPESSSATKTIHIWLLNQRKNILENLNIARILFFVFGPQIRAVLSNTPDDSVLAESLAITQTHLLEFATLSTQYGFQPRIYLIHPMQDLMNGTYHETVSNLTAIMPAGLPLISTAPSLLDHPAQYYYSFNGHLNPVGARRVATFLVESED